MKKIKTISYSLLYMGIMLVTALTSCTHQEIDKRTEELWVSDVHIGKTSNETTNHTRTSKSHFTTGDAIGVILTRVGEDNYGGKWDFAESVFDGSTWKNSAPLYVDGKWAAVHAFYPYGASKDNGRTIAVDIHSQTDYLLGKGDNRVNSGNAGTTITMKHILSKVVFQIRKQDYAGKAVLKSVTLSGSTAFPLYTSAVADVLSGDCRPDGNGDQLTTCCDTELTANPVKLEILVLPMRVSTSSATDLTATFVLETEHRQQICRVELPVGTHWRAGEAAVYPLVLSGEGMVLDKSGISIEPWQDGSQADGTTTRVSVEMYADGVPAESSVQTRAGSAAGYTLGSGTYHKGEVITVSAHPAQSYELESFSCVNDPALSGQSSYTFTVEKSVRFVAKFTKKQRLVYTVRLTKAGTRVGLPDLGSLNITEVDYGDGTKSAYAGSHTYTRAGEYTVTITGKGTADKCLFRKGYHEDKTFVKDILSNTLDMSGVTTLASAFADTAVESICEGMFDTCKGNVTSCRFIFEWCGELKQIPEGLFAGFEKCTTFERCFYNTKIPVLPANTFSGCVAAKDFLQACGGINALTRVEQGVFDHCSAATSFEGCFASCKNLSSIPAGLFSRCSRAGNFQKVFESCKALTTVPDNIFYRGQGQDFSGAFRQSGLRQISETLFRGMTRMKLDETFRGCTSYTGKLPTLWDGTYSVASHRQCFAACAYASNYKDVPARWIN